MLYDIKALKSMLDTEKKCFIMVIKMNINL